MSDTDGEVKPKPLTISMDNIPYKPKKKHPSFWQNLKDYISEYTGATSLHGFQYLGDQKRSIIEKIFWTFVISASLYICISLIFKTFEKWTNSPVIVSFAQSPTPVGEIPFPAVTICSETKSRQRIFNFTQYYHMNRLGKNMTAEESKNFQDASLLCDTHVLLEGPKQTDVSVLDFIEKVAPTFDDTLMSCAWKNQNETCPTLFTPMLSEEGICYTFNMLKRDDIYTNEVYHNKDFLNHDKEAEGWTLENGYPELSERETYPYRALTAGVKAGLTVLLKAYEKDFDYVCRGPVQGFKVLIHPPDEVPRVGMQFFRVPLDQEIIVAIKPDMMQTSPGLKDYDAHRRGCYFSQGKQLRFYKTYSQQNCDIECLTNITFAMCNCVAYHMPHTENTPICGSGSTECMTQAQISIVSSSVNNTQAGCDCLPACTSITYNAETSQADFNWEMVLQAYSANVSEFAGYRMARLSFFFKEMQFITSQRNELYGITDFMANCGGLLGLFIGFSFVSLIETLYFVSLRLVVNLKRYGRHFWSASEDLLNNDAYIPPTNDKNN